MSRWKPYILLNLALALGALGCGKGATPTTITLQISPTTASVITNTSQPFTPFVTGSTDQTATWAVTCPTGVTAPACGTIDANSGVYTAPKTVPTVTSNGTATVTPTATITATAHADTTKTATATVTIVSGISISITPTSATVGTGEPFTFRKTVNNPGCDTTAHPECLNVTWSVPTTAGVGSIDANGTYTAPGTAPNPSTVTITATSTADPTIFTTATVTVVKATDPTVTSVSPNIAGLGSLFQDIYITGTNFISTNTVFVNGVVPASLDVAVASSSVIRVRIPPATLAIPGILQVSVSQKKGSPQNCAPDPTKCQIVVTSVRPAVVGPSPDSLPQGSSGLVNFNVNGGFYGTSNLPTVHATFDGDAQTRAATVNNARQISVTIGSTSASNSTFNPADFSTPGLHQVAIRSDSDPTKFATTNLAIQPVFGSSLSTISMIGAAIPVGTTPSDVAINPATGRVIVANTGSGDVTVFDLATPTSTTKICSDTRATPCPASGPKSVAVDYVRNLALVANSTSNSIAVVDLGGGTTPPSVKSLILTQDPPVAVGINPVSGRALVTVNSSAHNYALLIDLTGTSPAIIGVVSINTGANSHVAVEPNLNWAVATPGGVGSTSVVDLGRQTTNQIANISRSAGVVTVQISTTPDQPLLAIQVGDAVFIRGVSNTSFDGVYTVASVGPGNAQFTYIQANDTGHPDVTSFSTDPTVTNASYSQPIATRSLGNSIQGVGINPVTQQAVLANPSAVGGVLFLNLLDLSTPVPALTSGNFASLGNVAGAFNELTNVAVVVNSSANVVSNQLAVIDPSTPGLLTTFTTDTTPVAVAIDPGSNTAVVVNQGKNSVWLIKLGPIQPLSITDTNPKMFVTNSTLANPPPTATPQHLTVVGKGFTSSSRVRLDGVQLGVPALAGGDRELTVDIPASFLTSPRRFAVDVLDGNFVTNVSDFTVVQSVDVAAGTGCTAAPLPSGVAIDPQQNLAVVSLFGCNSAALINLSNGTGKTVAVGTNPLGVAVLPRLSVAVVANNGSNNATVVPELGQALPGPGTITTGAGPNGVAADQDTGEVAVANTTANTVSILNITTGGVITVSNVQRPIAVAFNYRTHQVAIAASGSNSVDIASGTGGAATFPFGTGNIRVPTSVVYDPVPGDCPSNLDGCFLANSSIDNQLEILDPAATQQQQTAFAIGINPTAIAFNYLTSTLVSTNTASHTVTVVDFLGRRVRAVLSLPPAQNPIPAVAGSLALTGALQFAADIHPLTNLAVIADTANGRVLLVPLPR